MFRIDPEGLYSRSELIEAFNDLGVDFDSFVRRAAVPRRLRQAYLGSDLLEAIRLLPCLEGLKRSRRPTAVPHSITSPGKPKGNSQQDPGVIAARMARAVGLERSDT